MTVVCIVTPSFNSARFISQTINSVTLQSGDFDLYYHVQDGGSSDNTCAIVQDHIDRVAAGHDTACRSITMTLSSAPDDGMYDAINKGFSALPIDDAVLMTWINSDDLLCSGAISAALALVDQSQDTKWLGGRMVHVDVHGTVLSVHPPYLYPTALIAQGLCDGRYARFVQQEGAFWTPDLWKCAGGLSSKFRLAGDWDLWRRFARFAAFNTLDTLTGFHRRHPGQLSADLTDYHAEVDSAEPTGLEPARPVLQPTYYRYDHAKAVWKASNPATRVEDVLCRSSAAGTIFASSKVTIQPRAYPRAYIVHGPTTDAYIALISETPVAAGDIVEACVAVDLCEDARLLVRLGRHGDTEFEVSPSVPVDAKRGTNTVHVSHTFKHAHEGYRVQIASPAGPALIADARFCSTATGEPPPPSRS
ncbi:glycosyltransferase [Methyloceanibacter sp.]|uniref:glycosyltransferase n=1 Tax=Methyloceanibacter sp. TaxID=1965321 RepID=UPI002C119788|nr:glycosyltransferase [Methyloceanibacter sp.]HML91670.1 glycosyltransferase [Methyloceanibacter sp.]